MKFDFFLTQGLAFIFLMRGSCVVKINIVFNCPSEFIIKDRSTIGEYMDNPMDGKMHLREGVS